MNLKKMLRLHINRLKVLKLNFKHQYIMFMCEHGLLYKEHKVNRVESGARIGPNAYTNFSTYRAKGRVEYCADVTYYIQEDYYYPKRAEDTIDNSVYTLIYQHDKGMHLIMKAIVTEFLLNYPNIKAVWVKDSGLSETSVRFLKLDKTFPPVSSEEEYIPVKVVEVPLNFSRLHYNMEVKTAYNEGLNACLKFTYDKLKEDLPNHFEEMNRLLCGTDDTLEYDELYVMENLGCSDCHCEGIVVVAKPSIKSDIAVCVRCGKPAKINDLPILPHNVWAERYQNCRDRILQIVETFDTLN